MVGTTKVEVFFDKLCPSYEKAGDLGSIATTTAYYMTTNELLGSFLVGFMMFGCIFNTASTILHSMPPVSLNAQSNPSYEEAQKLSSQNTELPNKDLNHTVKNDMSFKP